MKNKYSLLILLLTLFSSCSTSQLYTVDDEFINEKNIKLIQYLYCHSDESKKIPFMADYGIKLKTVYQKPENKNGEVTTELTLTTYLSPEELDSIIFIKINGETIKLVSNQYKISTSNNKTISSDTQTKVDEEKDSSTGLTKNATTTTSSSTETNYSTSQIMRHRFTIPKNIWEKFIYPQELFIRFYIEDEGVNAKFSNADKRKLSKFFKTIINYEK